VSHVDTTLNLFIQVFVFFFFLMKCQFFLNELLYKSIFEGDLVLNERCLSVLETKVSEIHG